MSTYMYSLEYSPPPPPPPPPPVPVPRVSEQQSRFINDDILAFGNYN